MTADVCDHGTQRRRAPGLAAAMVILTLGTALAQQQGAAPSTAQDPSPKQDVGSTVFEDSLRDPYLQRYGHAPGDAWIPMPGTETELRFSGFAQINFIHDFQDTGFAFGDFIPSRIAVPTSDKGNTEFDPRTSRLAFETRTNTQEVGAVRTMISMDFAGQESEDSVQPRLRQAYVNWVGAESHISFTAGQAWSTYLDLGVWPELFDLEGPNAMTGLRQGLLRGSYAFGEDKDLVLDFAFEQPETAVSGGTGLREWPDLVARASWKQDWGHLQGAAIGRYLVAERTAGGGEDSAFGWGLSASGSWLVPGTRREDAPSDDLGPRQDSIQFQVQTGAGTGRYVFDLGGAATPQDAVYDDATATLTPLDEFGAFGAYHHWWTDRLRSQLVLGWVNVSTLATQPSDALGETVYVAGNLIYRVFPRMDVGVEYYWGEREDKGGATGHANRVLIGVNFGF